ncbi:MAG TPA: phage holin family protein [Acidimicrobiales bacterium]|jgi:uncharacterized membrane protein YqjE|nr:phage holin family protein [Acidimicrobiales bacterium]
MAQTNAHDVQEKPTAELVGDLGRELTTLIHQEMELARVELAEKGKRAGLGAGMFGAAAVLALFGIGCLTACVVGALAQVMSLWLAALIVAIAYLVVAGILALTGKREVEEATPPVPEQAVESTKEDVEWLKTQARSARR